MATYSDRFTKAAKGGPDVDIIFGIIHKGVALGTSTEGQTTVTFNPDTYGPFYPCNSYSADFTATEDDVVVYDDGVAVTVSEFTPSTGTAVISSPTVGSTMTGDIVEQKGLYIAQNATLTPKRETETLEQLRNSTTRKTYGNTAFTLKADFKVADLEVIKVALEETSTAGLYAYPNEPVEIYAAILIYDDNDDIEGIIYCESVKIDFSDIIKATAGKKAVENGFEMDVEIAPHLLDVAESLAG